MDSLQLLALALVQGITEFLPVSSSAHLILAPELLGWPDQGMAVDVAMHLGTLLAVVVYFRREAASMLKEALGQAGERPQRKDGLLVKVAVATVPVVLAGLLLKDVVEGQLRTGMVIAWTTIAFGVLLYVADRSGSVRTLDAMDLRDAALIGVAQALALVPGVSRAGVTMTAARFLGYSRADAARFSLLLSTPTILAACALIGYQLRGSGGLLLQPDVWLAAAFAFIAALSAIGLMMKWLHRASFTPFVVYRVLLGSVLLLWLSA